MRGWVIALALLPVGCGRGEDVSLGDGRQAAAAVGCTEPPGARTDLLADLVGFGRAATGGSDGCVVHVTSLADSGPGTLREAAERPEPLWIVFDVSGVVDLESAIQVASDKTLDGRGAAVTLRGHGLDLVGVSNVIVENLTVTGDAASAGGNSGTGDGISLDRGSNTIWVNHCSLSAMPDELIAIAHGATDVTVSWCHFSDQDQVMLIGANPEDVEDVDIRATIHHCWFDHTGSYHPRLRHGRAHVLNNLVDRWVEAGMQCTMAGEIYSEGNVLDAGDDTGGIEIEAGDDTEPGKARSVGDLLQNGAVVNEGEPTGVFDPSASYAYTAEVADPALADRLETEAGAR